jgi:hypothetical protein
MLTKVLEDIPQDKREESNVFETLIGTEPEMSERDYNNGGWYNANIGWFGTKIGWFGTKWDVSYNDCQFQFTEDSIIMMPQTAWSPPVGFGVRLHEMYGVNVELQYEESGCDFCGKTTIENQNIVTEDYDFLEGKYRLDNESFWYEIESNIEYALDDDKSVDEFMTDFSFVDEEDFNEIRGMYENSLAENKSE